MYFKYFTAAVIGVVILAVITWLAESSMYLEIISLFLF